MGGLADTMPTRPAQGAPEIEFEREYRDRITGFVGKCTGFCRYISGCDQVLLQPSIDKDGKRQEGIWLDDERLIDVETDEPVERTSTRGADTPAPVR
jgi:hypothetical protein